MKAIKALIDINNFWRDMKLLVMKLTLVTQATKPRMFNTQFYFATSLSER